MASMRIRRSGTKPTQNDIDSVLAETFDRLEKWKQSYLRLLGTLQKYTPEPGSDGGRHLASTLEGWNNRVIADAIGLATTISAYADMMRG